MGKRALLEAEIVPPRVSEAATPGSEAVPDLFAELVPLPDYDSLAAEWSALQDASEHSFFQSWGWIGCWLRLLPQGTRALLLRVRIGGETVGLAVLLERRVWRRGLVHSRSLYLHETGRPEIDELTIEHNGVLVRRDCAGLAQAVALARLVEEVAAGRFDEIILSGVGPDYRQAAEGIRTPKAHLLVWKCEPSHVVELDRLRSGGPDGLGALAPSTRKGIRRALRRAEEYGPLKVEEARSVEEALTYLDALIELHQARWTGAGERGAFYSPWLRRFHAALVASRLPEGEIQLLRVSAGESVLGYLYHFQYRQRLYCYQWGLVRDEDRRISAGLVCEALSLKHNLEQPVRIYDLLHGDTEHKRRFGTHCEARFWLVLQRRRLDFGIENWMREVRRKLLRRGT